MPSDASATTCRNRFGALKPVSPPPNASAAPGRLILIGSYMEHVTQTDPDRKARLMKGLDVFLERDRERELFDLAPRPKDGEIAPS